MGPSNIFPAASKETAFPPRLMREASLLVPLGLLIKPARRSLKGSNAANGNGWSEAGGTLERADARAKQSGLPLFQAAPGLLHRGLPLAMGRPAPQHPLCPLCHPLHWSSCLHRCQLGLRLKPSLSTLSDKLSRVPCLMSGARTLRTSGPPAVYASDSHPSWTR